MIPQQKKLLLTILMASFLQMTAIAQRVFVKNVRGLNRSYSYQPPTVEQPNQPLIVMLHPNGSNAKNLLSLLSDHAFSKPVHLVFPEAMGGQWFCEQEKGISNIAFIQVIIDNMYDNFRIDRNRVFVIGDSTNACLIKAMLQNYPEILTDTRIAEPDEAISDIADEMLAGTLQTSTSYALWTDPVVKYANAPPVKYGARRRWVIGFNAGDFSMSGSVETGIKDGTNIDLSRASSSLGIHVTRWMGSSKGWFVDLNRISVPAKVQNVGVNTKFGTALLVPLTGGLKYSFLPNAFIRPYAMAGGGVTWVYAGGGKVNSANSGATGSKPQNVKADSRFPVHGMLGGGLDVNLGKRFNLGANARYIYSTSFSSIGEINAVRGLNTNFSVAYMFYWGSNKESN